MASNLLNFPQKKQPLLLPEVHCFDVSDDEQSPSRTFIFTDQRGNKLTLEFGEPELGPVLDLHAPDGRLLFHLCLTMMTEE